MKKRLLLNLIIGRKKALTLYEEFFHHNTSSESSIRGCSFQASLFHTERMTTWCNHNHFVHAFFL